MSVPQRTILTREEEDRSSAFPASGPDAGSCRPPLYRGQRDKGLGKSNASHSSNPSTNDRIWILPGPITGMPAMARCALPAWYNVYRNRNNWEPIASGSQAPWQYSGTHCLWLTSPRADRILAMGYRLIQTRRGSMLVRTPSAAQRRKARQQARSVRHAMARNCKV
jgi:hypothetical protein